MSVDWLDYLFPPMIVGLLATELSAYLAKLRMSESAPDYAQRLFRSWDQRLSSSIGPCRFKVLYLESPPSGLEKTVWTLRAIHLTGVILICAFTIALVPRFVAG